MNSLDRLERALGDLVNSDLVTNIYIHKSYDKGAVEISIQFTQEVRDYVCEISNSLGIDMSAFWE